MTSSHIVLNPTASTSLDATLAYICEHMGKHLTLVHEYSEQLESPNTQQILSSS